MDNHRKYRKSQMTAHIFEEFVQVLSWRRGDEHAPHKPLLILYALGALSRGQELLLYSTLELPLTELLRDFGPSRTRLHPEYPFVRLKNDGIWEIHGLNESGIESSELERSLTILRKEEVRGGFRSDIKNLIKNSPHFLSKLVRHILDENFPDTLHEELIERCGIELRGKYYRHRRNLDFRLTVLEAYNYKCAVCGFSAQSNGRYLALEAAHIKWHAFGGADSIDNGIALCSLHHNLFDFGAFGIHEGMIVYSENIVGNQAFDIHCKSFHGKSIGVPNNYIHRPLKENIAWHSTAVFKYPARKIKASEG